MIDLIVRSVVVCPKELGHGMLNCVGAGKENPGHHGVRFVKRFEPLVKMDFYPLRLVEACQHEFLILESGCGTVTIQPQGVGREAQFLYIDSAVKEPARVGRCSERWPAESNFRSPAVNGERS